MKTVWIVVPAVAAAAVLGFSAQRWLGGSSEPVSAEVAAGTTDAASPLADDATATSAPTIPATLPQFELADRDGRMRTLGDWSGKPLLVNYWATWCAPCRREIPLLNELRAPGNPHGVEVIGIAVDFREDVLAYASETPIDYPLLIGEEDGLTAVTAMGMQPAFPFTVFADSKQRILTVKVGELHADDAELILSRLTALDAGRLPLEQARAEIDAGLKELATRRAAKGEADLPAEPAATPPDAGTAG
jgi:thiol-disulfide isomerase/thioredoxin